MCEGSGVSVGHRAATSCRVPGAQPLWLPAGLLKGIEGRAEQAAEYAQLLADCQQIYCDTRLLLVVPVVQQHILDSSADPLTTLMRQGCAYLIQVGVPGVGLVRPVWRRTVAFCSRRLNPSVGGTRPGLAPGCCRHLLTSLQLLLHHVWRLECALLQGMTSPRIFCCL